MRFKEWFMENEDFFNQSSYKINGQVYSVPQLAQWAKSNLQVSKLPVSEIQRRYIWADKLFIDVDDSDEWATRSMGTALNFPILMLAYPDGKWEIIDGNHRTWKAWKSGMKTVDGYLIPSNQIPPPNQLLKPTT